MLLVSIMLLLTSCGTVNKQYANTNNDDTGTTSASVTVSESNTSRDANKIIEELVVYYGTYGSEADEKVDELITEFRSTDTVAADKWRKITDRWDEVNGDLTLNYDELPDGLPDTDELCIVALGFQLEPDGTMKSELIERLKVVLNSAQKYPDALIVCTGGGTATENKSATESGEMAKWLTENGIDENIRANALELFKALALNDIKEGKNTMISPLSFMTAMGLLENGAKGDSLKEIENAFGYSIEEFNEWYDAWSKLMMLQSGDTLKIANSVWYKNDPLLKV